MKRTLLNSFLALGWIGTVVAGLGLMLVHSKNPGVPAGPLAIWPSHSTVHLAQDKATLVMLLHPKCPCSRATIDELNGVMAECDGKLAAYVFILKPEGVPAGWEKTDLWTKAAAIPGVQVLSDDGGAEASLFGAQTSGQTLLFEPSGKLLFRGGITGARGHSGHNAGRDAVVSWVMTGKAMQDGSDVFGCSLHSAGDFAGGTE